MKKTWYFIFILFMFPLISPSLDAFSASPQNSGIIGPLKPKISVWDDPNYVDIRYTHDEVLAGKIRMTGYLFITLGTLMLTLWFRPEWSRGVRTVLALAPIKIARLRRAKVESPVLTGFEVHQE